MINKLKWTTCIALWFHLSIGLAQTEAPENALSNLKDIVVSGNKFNAEKKEIAQTIDVITIKTLKFNSLGSMSEVLQNTGTITVQQSQNGGGSPIIRGLEANRIGIVVDGVRMNTAIFRAGHLQNVMRVDNGQLDNLEIYYGAGSTLYGSDALGGVLNFTTAKPKLKRGDDTTNSMRFSGSAFLRYANASNEKSGGFTLNVGGKKFAALTAFSYSNFGNLMMGNIRDSAYGNWGKRLYYQVRSNGKDSMVLNPNPNEQVGTAYAQYNILQKFYFVQNENTNHLFNIQYSNSTDVPRYDRLTERAKGMSLDENPISNKFSSAEWFYGPESRTMLAYTLNHRMHNFFADRMRITAAYQNYKESRNNRSYGNNNSRSQMENVDMATLNVDLTKHVKVHQLAYGIETVNNFVASSVNRYNILTGAKSYASTRYPDGGSITGNYAIYVQDIIELQKDLAYLNVGGRYSLNTISCEVTDTFRKYGSFDITNHGFSFNTGLSLLPSRNNKLTLNVSSGYRSPNLDDVTKIFDNTNWIQVNSPNVKPEMAVNYEFNSWNKIADVLTLEFGAYYTYISDFISNEATSVNGQDSAIIDGVAFSYQKLGNASSAKITGAYGSMRILVGKHVDFWGNLNFINGRRKVANTAPESPLDHIPPMSGKVSVQYFIPKFKSELSLLFNGAKETAEYGGGEDNPDKSANPLKGYTPSWYTLNLRASYEIVKNITVQAALENIMDSHYRVFASGISAPGRNMRLTLRANF